MKALLNLFFLNEEVSSEIFVLRFEISKKFG